MKVIYIIIFILLIYKPFFLKKIFKKNQNNNIYSNWLNPKSSTFKESNSQIASEIGA